MKQKIIKILTTLIIVLIIVLQNTKVFCVTSSSDYTIQSYNIKMTVNEDNTFDITEKITAYFNNPKHGIYRKIPNSLLHHSSSPITPPPVNILLIQFAKIV